MPVYGENGKIYNTTLVSHTSDLAYYFNSMIPLKGQDTKMSLWMIDRVSAFVYGKEGLVDAHVPRELSQGMIGWESWPTFTQDKNQWMVINHNATVGMVQDLHLQDCDFWDSQGYNF